MKRRFTSLVVGAALALAPLSAMAADSQPQPQADLTPGPAAGVQTAQSFTMGTLGYVAVGVAVVAIVVIVASGGGGNGNSSSTTTTGAP
jgi:hypothetical protein